DERFVMTRDQLRHISGRLQPDLRWVEEEQALVPAVVVLAIGLQAVGGGNKWQAAVALDPDGGGGVGQGAALGVVAGVVFKDGDAMFGAVSEAVKGVDVAERAAKIRARPIRPNMDIEPDFATMRLGQGKDFLLR